MSKQDGGPAFPLPLGSMNRAEPLESGGMTLRDYFAAAAPSKEIEELCPQTIGKCAAYLGMKHDEHQQTSEYVGDKHWKLVVAKARYEWADAMLAERAK